MVMCLLSMCIKDKGQFAIIDPKDVSRFVILTDLDSNNGGAIPSPDGKQIAFVSDKDSNNAGKIEEVKE